jgi:hypothetical protein
MRLMGGAGSAFKKAQVIRGADKALEQGLPRIRLGRSTFSIFGAFPDNAGRQAHLPGKVAAALMAKAA